jgi:hypothetical protein
MARRLPHRTNNAIVGQIGALYSLGHSLTLSLQPLIEIS